MTEILIAPPDWVDDGSAEVVTLRATYAHGMVCRAGVWFRYYQNFRKDGQVDGRRSRYWVNGRIVSRQKYEEAGGMA